MASFYAAYVRDLRLGDNCAWLCSGIDKIHKIYSKCAIHYSTHEYLELLETLMISLGVIEAIRQFILGMHKELRKYNIPVQQLDEYIQTLTSICSPVQNIKELFLGLTIHYDQSKLNKILQILAPVVAFLVSDIAPWLASLKDYASQEPRREPDREPDSAVQDIGEQPNKRQRTA